jgi:sulfide:quinone oxidoreductase
MNNSEAISRLKIGNELNHAPTHKHILQLKDHQNIFIWGDATNNPSSDLNEHDGEKTII